MPTSKPARRLRIETAFPVPLTSALSGATVDQLAYWRRRTRSHPSLLVPSAQRSGRFLYSWADVVALRSIVYPRQAKSLPRIRRAVRTLAELEADEWEHLSRYRHMRTATTIVVATPDGRLMDLEREPGTMLDEILMADVLEPFSTEDGRCVPSLSHPRPRLSVDPAVLGGYPVVAGTRVPFDVVAGLADDGMRDAEIIQMYPSVQAAAVADARAFAEVVAPPHRGRAMRLLVDEGVLVQILKPLRLNVGHEFVHVTELGWAARPDRALFADARSRFDAIVALDVNQLADPGEWPALNSRLHHVSLRHGRTARGRTGIRARPGVAHRRHALCARGARRRRRAADRGGPTPGGVGQTRVV